MKKKKFRKHCSKAMLCLVAASIVTSCNNDYLEEKSSFDQIDFAPDNATSISLLPIELYVGEDYNDVLSFIDSFTENILSNPNEALEFRRNPSDVLKKYNLDNISVDRNSPEIQLIFALSEPEILEAINNNDVNKMLDLLQNKGLLQSDKTKNMHDMVSQLEKLRSSSTGIATTRIDNAEKSLVAICLAGVLIYVAAATVAETIVIVHCKFAMWGLVQSAQDTQLNAVLDKNVIKLWAIAKNNDGISYDVSDELHNSVVMTANTLGEKLQLEKDEIRTISDVGLGTVDNVNNKKQ